MTKTQIHHLGERVRVEVSASRYADLEQNALRKAASAFEGYESPEGWRSSSGRMLRAVMVGDVTPETEQPMLGKVLTWRADFLVGLDSRDLT